MPLTDVVIRNAQYKTKPYKITDERGMYLLVSSTGKYFRFDYRFSGKRKTLSLGVYPDVSLSKARQKREEARRLLQDGIDPNQHKRAVKAAKKEIDSNSFESIAREFLSKNINTWSEGYYQTVSSRLENNIFPWLGSKPVASIEPPELLEVLRKMEGRGAVETAHRVSQVCGQIFRYAIATGRAKRDPSADLRGALASTKAKPMASVRDIRKVGELLRAIDGYQGHFITCCALRLSPLVFVRPGELRHAEWSEIDLEQAMWKIPAEKMKMAETHIVPLSKQAILILKEIESLTGNGKYIFPSLRTSKRPMSENTILAALRRLGYSKDEMTPHGFRAMASTVLHEKGWKSEVIERQLAHRERNKVKAAYNHAEYLQDRRNMMQYWADLLDDLKAGKPERSVEKWMKSKLRD